ncbi:cell envelope biogenesis protein OmpA [Lacinutrix salivirga]
MNQEDKLSILKDILLTDEREYASSIHEKIKILEETINKQKNLSEKVDPIITDKLEAFVEEMPKTLGPAITETLRHEIKNSQAQVVEALYPIMGKMIKKYIQNEIALLTEKVNEQVNNSFSFKNLKRKFFSKKSGASEGELILKDQFKPEIEQLMVIEKGSGIIMSEYSKTQNIDQDMVAGMLTAIKSFAEDAFQKNDQDLQYIEYDLYHIHLQNFSSYYIAVVISGAFNTVFKSKLEDKLLDFAQNYINKEDLDNKESFSNKLKVYFENENL